jgi:hypothetical protein
MLKTVYFTLLGAIAVFCFGMLVNMAFAGTVGDPYTGTPIAINGTPGATTIFEAENLDKGGEGVAYHSLLSAPCTTSTCSCTQSYRQETVGICGAPPTTFVTYTGPGTWYDYTISISSVGSYTVELLVAMADANCCAGAAYHVMVDGVDVTGSVPLGPAQMANWVAFEWRGKSALFPMVPGQHTLTIVVDKGWFNWDSVRVKYAAGIEWQQVPVWKVYQ